MREENKIQKIKSLLDKVFKISKKYEERAKKKGENYNVFNILGLSTREVRTHSAFIADLLDVEGYHEQGSVFLELFYDQLKKNPEIRNKKLKIPSKEAKVIVEENIGEISEDEGGRIDIVIKDNNKQLLIENKIHAGDQYKQLVRYINKYPNAILLYLTLQEQEASDKSITRKDGSKLKKDEEYFNITYKEDITKWLKRCKEKSTSHPFLKGTLKQYINLIKQLTGQTMSDKMGKEITELFRNSDNFESAIEITNNFENFKKELLKNFWDILIEELGQLKGVLNVEDIALDNTGKVDNTGVYFQLNGIDMFVWSYKDGYVYYGTEEVLNKNKIYDVEDGEIRVYAKDFENNNFILNNINKGAEFLNFFKKENVKKTIQQMVSDIEDFSKEIATLKNN